MDLGQKGVFWFTDALTRAQLIELAQCIERLGYAALWYPEALSYESFGLGGFLLSQTDKLVVASGIANIYARDATATKPQTVRPSLCAALRSASVTTPARKLSDARIRL